MTQPTRPTEAPMPELESLRALMENPWPTGADFSTEPPDPEFEYLRAVLQTSWPAGADFSRESQAKFTRAVGVKAIQNVLAAVAARPTSTATLATVYRHGDRSYSVGDGPPWIVGFEEDLLLSAFLKSKGPLSRAQLEDVRGVTNAPRAVTRLLERYNGAFARAVRRPRTKGKGGYYADVRPAP